MKKAVLWALPFLLGLAIAWTIAQAQGDGPSSDSVAVGDDGTETTLPPVGSLLSSDSDEESETTTTLEAPVLSADLVAAAEPDEAPADVVDGERARSVLADVVQPLSSAFPDIALEGVGEPIGFQPLSLSIPDLGVGAAEVEPVGIEPNGELEVPGAETVGWYRFGSGIDGGRGSTVIAGHIAYNGVDGVFRNLADMVPGQEFTVDHGDDSVTYRVTEVIQYDKTDLPIDDLFREDGEERIVLITCGGFFNPSIRSYDDNVVVIGLPV